MMVVHRDKLRWLFWLRWKLFLRGFTRDRSRIIGAIVAILFGIPIFGGIAGWHLYSVSLFARASQRGNLVCGLERGLLVVDSVALA